MNLLKNKYLHIAIAFAGGILLRNFIMKSADKKPEVLESLDTPEMINFRGNAPITPAPSTTPVSGTSDNILHQIDEEQANNLKQELK